MNNGIVEYSNIYINKQINLKTINIVFHVVTCI